MKIQVPEWARKHFWQDPPEGHCEFWAFSWKPKAGIGETIYFYFDNELVAEATIFKIESPNKSKCASTGRFENRWKVFWRPESFIDMRKEIE